MKMRGILIASIGLVLAACSDQPQPSGQKAPSSANSSTKQVGAKDASTANGNTSAGSTPITGSMMVSPMTMTPGMMPPSTAGTVATGTTVTTTTPAATTAPVVATAIAEFKHLPILSDADGNPNDNAATYNLTVDANVPVTVVTPTATWTTPMMRYNSLQLPPVIVAKRGSNINVNVQNNLTQATTVHWHGFKIPASQDGGPDLPIAAGAARTYTFQLAQAAAPLWFHPHANGTTATQVYNGLAGAFVVTDEITQNLETTKQLPSGAYDIPLLVQDRRFAADPGTGIRALTYGGMMVSMTGMLGNTVLVNGVQQPTLKVETRQYRFKVFNGSNARTYDLALSNNELFTVIGTDGGLLPAPVRTDHLVLSAGERAEIVVDFRTTALNTTVSLLNRLAGTSTAPDVMRFDVATQSNDDVTLYANLPNTADINQRLPASSATRTRNFALNTVGMMRFAINGKLFDMNRIDERVGGGTTEIWAISNTTAMAHPFHAHAIQWQVLDRSNVPASGVDLGWKDTVLVNPGETVRIIGRFDPVINKGLYMFHCHILEHEEAGMMGTFFIQ